MITAIGLTAITITVLMSGGDAEFIARVEKAELLNHKGETVQRVQRDAKGNVEKLQLSGMHLSADDFAAIGKIRTLRNLNLNKTNVADADLRALHELPHLEGLTLNSTEVTDAAVAEIMKCDSLRWLCLGDVAVTPEAVAQLKAHFRARERRLSLGYFQRK